MENSERNLQEQQEKDERIDTHDQTPVNDDASSENSEFTPAEEGNEKEDNGGTDELDGGKAANNPSPDDDAQLDIETVAP